MKSLVPLLAGVRRCLAGVIALEYPARRQPWHRPPRLRIGTGSLQRLAWSIGLFLTVTSHAQTGPGSSLFIAGTVNYVAVPHTAAFNSLPITVMAWVNTVTATGQQGLINKYSANSRNGWNIFLLNGRVRAWYYVNGSRNVAGGGNGMDGGFIADGRWHHIAFMVDSSGAVILVDGVQQASQPWTGASGSPTTTQEVRFGSYPGGNNGFVGSIFLDDVSVWNGTLTFPQIRTSRDGGLTGLEANRLAFYRCDEGSGTTVADSAPLGGSNNGSWTGPALFDPVIPFAQTLLASSIDFTQATLNGIATPNRSTIAVGFEWGTTTAYGTMNVAATLNGVPTTDQNYSLSTTGLTPGTTYHFRAFTSNSVGVVTGADRTFTTLNPVETLPASALALASARLNGEVTTLGTGMTAWFEWGPTTNYGNMTPPMNVANSPNAVPVSADITGPFQGQTNHFRLVATNANGRANGASQSFSIPAFPGPAGLPPLRSSAYSGSLAGVTFDPRPEWDPAVPMTIEAWVYREDAARTEAIVSHAFPGSYWLGFAPKLRFYRGTNFVELTTPVPARKWTHVAVSYDGAVARFHLNGEHLMSRGLDHTGAGKNRLLRLGYDSTATEPGQPGFVSNRFIGSLDEIRLWSVARTSGEIRDGLYREVRGEPGLMSVFPRGGRIEELSGRVGSSGGGLTEQIFGMVPRDLVVPRAAITPNPNGELDLVGEYLGAEQLVLRYPGDPLTPDAVAYFVHTTNDLFVGVRGLRAPDPGVPPSDSFLGLFIDTAYERPLLAGPTQAVVRVLRDLNLPNPTLLHGDGGGGFFDCPPCVPVNSFTGDNGNCDGETRPPCTEFRVSRSLLGSFDEFDGVALGHFDFSPFADQAFAPDDGFTDSPATWLTMSYGEASASLPRVRFNGRVLAGLTSTAPPLAGHLMSLFTSGASYGQITDASGRFSFDVPMPRGQFINAQPAVVSFGRSVRPFVCTNCLPNDVEPELVFTNGVLFPALGPDDGGIIQLARADFFVQPPLGPATLTSATPANPQCGMVVRLGEPGGEGELVTIFGTNLHAELEFYMAPVSETFPTTPAFWNLFPVAVVNRDPGGNWVQVRAPFLPEFVAESINQVFIPAFTSPWRWVAYDLWFRPERVDYSFSSSFSIRRPPYPIAHGFRFDNQGATPGLNEFLACYGTSAYICAGPICVPDPIYWGLWFQAYKYWVGESGGSCVGMASTAVQIHNGFLNAADFDPLAFTAHGLLDPGFPGTFDTSNTGGRSTRPPVPLDAWAHIRQNHGVQTTLEYLDAALPQASLDSGLSGSPTARLPEIRNRTLAQTICLVKEIGEGHCVTPYRVEDNAGGDTNLARIWVYDNNSPCGRGAPATSACVTSRFIDVNLSSNVFQFVNGSDTWTGTAMFAIPQEVYNGRRTAPIDLLGLGFGITRLMAFVAGGADGHYASPAGEWGWRADGSFHSNYPGLFPLTPLGSPDNVTRSIPVVLTHSNNFALSDLAISAHTRHSNAHIFHVSGDGTLLQLETFANVAGHSNQFRLGTHSNQLASFRFTPQGAHSNFISRVGFTVHSNASATFQWTGLRTEEGRTQEFRALKDRQAVEYRNETTHSNTHHLRIDAVDGTHSNNTCSVFGPFTVPPGAAHCVVLHEWPRARTVRSELDLDADGTPDQITIVTGTEIDTDGDGMPDAWETLHQLNPEAVDCDDGADADPDLDGISNRGEYLTGTDPHDPLSALRVTAALIPGNRVRLSWQAIPGRRYEVLYADDLWHIFRPLAGAGFPRIATSAVESFEHELPAGAARSRFYQIRLAP